MRSNLRCKNMSEVILVRVRHAQQPIIPLLRWVSLVLNVLHTFRAIGASKCLGLYRVKSRTKANASYDCQAMEPPPNRFALWPAKAVEGPAHVWYC